MQALLLEVIYIFGGFISLIAGFYALNDKNNSARYGTALFWILFGLIFIIGKHLPAYIIGISIMVMGLLSLTKQVKITVLADSDETFKEQQSEKLGAKIWIPALSIGIIAILLAPIKAIGGLNALGISSLLAFFIALFFVKESPVKGYTHDAPRLLHNMGAAIILPQILGSLGTIFTKAGVGDLISESISGLVPIGNPFTGVMLYCISMALFTMIMGNAFAAFAVITAGIGIPFVIQIGGDPVIVGALGLTAGYCGTLMTPMAANFNIVPATILEMDQKNGILKVQAPIALILLFIHIILMYFLAF